MNLEPHQIHFEPSCDFDGSNQRENDHTLRRICKSRHPTRITEASWNGARAADMRQDGAVQSGRCLSESRALTFPQGDEHEKESKEQVKSDMMTQPLGGDTDSYLHFFFFFNLN